VLSDEDEDVVASEEEFDKFDDFVAVKVKKKNR